MSTFVGSIIAHFQLFNAERRTANLAETQGKKLHLSFFQLAVTSTCLKLLCTLRDNISQYNGANAQVFGILAKWFFTLTKFKVDQQSVFYLQRKYNRKAPAAYSFLYNAIPAFSIDVLSKKSALVIDKQAVVGFELYAPHQKKIMT